MSDAATLAQATNQFLDAGVMNVAACSWFFICWVGYTLYADTLRRSSRSLMTVMHDYRCLWMERMLDRDMRMVDMNIMAMQTRSVTLFASTSIFILAGLMAMLGALDTVREVVEGIPFADKAGQGMAEAKLLVLVMVFIYAFFKFAWSLRQFNFASVLIGAAPLHDRIEALERDSIVARSARMNTNAVSGFNSGVRAYYFGLAALSWFVHPWAFMAASTWVVLVLYRREFHSFTLRTLTSEDGDPAQSP